MPDSRHKEYDQDVQLLAKEALPAAAERNIDVIAQPAAKRNVPAAPELVHRRRKIGCTEIGIQPESQQTRRTDRDAGVGIKVRIEIKPVQNDAEHRIPAAQGRIQKRRIILGKRTGNHKLLKGTEKNQCSAPHRMAVLKYKRLRK